MDVPLEHRPAPDQLLERLRREFVFGIDDHIRTRLAGIIGMVDLLLETRLDDRQKEYVSSARVCAADLLEQLNSVLELSQLVRGTVPEKSEFNLREMVEGVAQSYGADARARGIDFRVHLDESFPCSVVGDPVMVGKTLAHLFAGGLRGAGRGEIALRVAVTADTTGQRRLRFELQVTGDGVAATHFERVLDSLWHAHGSLARRLPGLALDTALLQALAHVMSGHLAIETRPDSGSLVRVTLPIELPDHPRPLL